MPKRLLPATSALLAGLALGWWAALRAQPPARAEIEALRGRIERADQEVARLESETGRLRAELQAASARAGSSVAQAPRTATPPIDPPPPLRPNPGLLRSARRADATRGNGEDLDRRGPHLPGLTKVEREQVLGAAADVRARLHGIERARMVQTPAADGATVYRIPAFPEEGAALRRELSDRVVAILGPERGPDVVAVLEPKFGPGEFGSRERTITVSVDDTAGSPSYQVREESGGNESRSTRSSSSGGDVPEDYRHLFRAADAPP